MSFFRENVIQPISIVLLIILSILMTTLLLKFNDLEYTKLDKVVEYTEFQKSAGKIKETVPPMIISAYSYYDNIAAVIPFLKPIGTTVYCRYFDKIGNEIKPAVKSVVYPLFVVYCESRNAVGLTVSDSADTDVLTGFIVPIRKFEGNKHHLTHCGAPVFGNEPKWLQFVEMIEHYRLQGVTKFTFYIREVNFYDSVLLEFYKKEKVVEIVKIPSVFIDVVSQQLMAVADCHLRSKLESKWTIYSDIDERLIMTDENETVSGFLKNLQDASVGSVLFQQKWIMKRKKLPEKYKNDDQVIKEMPTMAWHETTPTTSECEEQTNCWGKQVVDNQKVNRILVHDIAEFKSGYRQLTLNSTQGYIRHYRDTSMENWETEKLKRLKFNEPMSNTSYPEKLGQKLISNVLNVLHKVYG